jgi:hypothetical protein
MKSQKDAVFEHTMQVLHKHQISCNGSVGTLLDKDKRKEIVSDMVSHWDEMVFDQEMADRVGEFGVAERTSYCAGLLSNWLRKDKRLNGGISYDPVISLVIHRTIEDNVLDSSEMALIEGIDAKIRIETSTFTLQEVNLLVSVATKYGYASAIDVQDSDEDLLQE